MEGRTQKLLSAESTSLPPRRSEGTRGVANGDQPPSKPAERALAKQHLEWDPLLESPGQIGPGDWAESDGRKRSHNHADLPPHLLPALCLQEGPGVGFVLGEGRLFINAFPSWPVRDRLCFEEG